MSFDHATSPCFHVHPVDAWNEPQTWVTWLWGGVTHLVGNEQLWYRARIRAVGVTLAGFFCQTKGATRIFQQKVQYGVRNMLIQSMIWYSCPFFPCFFVSYVFQFPGLENTTLKRSWKTPLLEFGTSSDHTLNISLIEEPTKDFWTEAGELFFSLHPDFRIKN